MKVLSLFDGISCGYLALQRAGIPIETYYASEIDKTCIKVSQKHFPNIIQLGDVNNWRTWDIPWKDIDRVRVGCIPFSSSTKSMILLSLLLSNVILSSSTPYFSIPQRLSR